MLSPAQCRAARALLNWSQADLEGRSKIGKKTIADFEREIRGRLHLKSEDSIREAFEEAGLELIAQNGGGDGVRFRQPFPRFVQLFRRDNIDHRNWVAFAFDYKNERRVGFVKHDALGITARTQVDPIQAFDENREAILLSAAAKFDRGELDPGGRALIQSADLNL